MMMMRIVVAGHSWVLVVRRTVPLGRRRLMILHVNWYYRVDSSMDCLADRTRIWWMNEWMDKWMTLNEWWFPKRNDEQWIGMRSMETEFKDHSLFFFFSLVGSCSCIGCSEEMSEILHPSVFSDCRRERWWWVELGLSPAAATKLLRGTLFSCVVGGNYNETPPCRARRNRCSVILQSQI